MKLLLFFCLLFSCANESQHTQIEKSEIIVAAEQLDLYLTKLKDKNVAIVANQTSTIGKEHLVDKLIAKDIQIRKVFAPEHGFRGKADAGELIKSGVDTKTGLPIISLYGKNKKPTKDQLSEIEIVLFDIQDVGVRFYTYISTLHYVMEACAKNNIPLIVLDRPNPNAHYIDGPILEPDYKSFIGMHPVPIVYGMTIGEYAQMIKGEAWIAKSDNLDLTIIPCRNYDHKTIYELPIKPSPNLPNLKSILLYPYLCFFEGTNVSVGRGTNKQFQVIGNPIFKNEKLYHFTPLPNEGAKYPKLENQQCFGDDLSAKEEQSLFKNANLDLSYLLEYAAFFKAKNEPFFLENLFFDKLAGTSKLREDILAGKTEHDIKASWKEDISSFKKIRKKYLIY